MGGGGGGVLCVWIINHGWFSENRIWPTLTLYLLGASIQNTCRPVMYYKVTTYIKFRLLTFLVFAELSLEKKLIKISIFSENIVKNIQVFNGNPCHKIFLYFFGFRIF